MDNRARIKPRLSEAAPAVLGLLTHLVDTLNHCVALKRRIIEGLQPSSLSHLGLVATLGFDPGTRSSSAHGLAGMSFRVEAEGGIVYIESAPGKGTLIRVTLPESTNGTP